MSGGAEALSEQLGPSTPTANTPTPTATAAHGSVTTRTTQPTIPSRCSPRGQRRCVASWVTAAAFATA